MLTWTAIEGDKDEMKLRLFVDRSSVEAFGDGGRFAMTNQVFPSEPYNHISFYSKGGAYKVDSFDGLQTEEIKKRLFFSPALFLIHANIPLSLR